MSIQSTRSYWLAGTIFIFLIIVLLPAIANALSPGQTPPLNFGTPGEAPRSGQSVPLENPLGASNSNLADFLAKLLRALIFVGLPFAALFLLWAGFQFVWARGNTEKLETARRNLLYIVIGIAIFVAASAIATLIDNTIRQLK